jgi:hypothetical protein
VLSIDTGIFGATQMQFDTTWKRIQVHYDSANCSQSINTTTDLVALEESWVTVSEYEPRLVDGNCEFGYKAFCTLHVGVPFSLLLQSTADVRQCQDSVCVDDTTR